MPTVEEILEGTVEWVQRGMESQCHWCGGTSKRMDHQQVPCKCPTCDGAGFYELAGAAKHKCGLCQGSGEWHEFVEHEVPCEECEDGMLRYGRFHTDVVNGVLNACIGAMCAARGEEDFDRVNRVLDWAWKYCSDCMAAAMQDAQDDPGLLDRLAKSFKQAGQIRPKNLGPKFVSSPIPPDELEKLLADHEAEKQSG